VENNQFKIQLRGSASDNENVRLTDFIEELTAIRETLIEIDKKISESKTPTTDYRIIDLTHSSPSTVLIEAIPSDSIDRAIDVVETFFYGLEKIQKGIAPDNFDSPILEKYKKISTGFKRRVDDVTFFYKDNKIQIDRNLEHKIALILGEDEIGDGFVEGSLEMINFHKGINKFNIYPSIGPDKIVCHFSGEILSQAIHAVGEYIRVIGKLKYKKRDRFPYAIEVLEIKIHPQEKDLPTLFSLRGIAPNILDGLSSEEFVKKVRYGR
jgi:hypothetical protein